MYRVVLPVLGHSDTNKNKDAKLGYFPVSEKLREGLIPSLSLENLNHRHICECQHNLQNEDLSTNTNWVWKFIIKQWINFQAFLTSETFVKAIYMHVV